MGDVPAAAAAADADADVVVTGDVGKKNSCALTPVANAALFASCCC